MDYRAVIILCTQLWVILAKSDCPRECTCVRADIGGTVAHCSELNINQVFPNSIHHLNVTNAIVTELQSNFFQKVHLEDLQTIKIINSSLTFIDEFAFAGMNNLNILNLANNTLRHVHPDTFKNNFNLQLLSLSGNKISLSSGMHDYFLNSLVLTDLDLSGCQLRDIPTTAFNSLPNLATLNLESNHIHFITYQMFENLTILEEINLSNNYITDLDPLLLVDIEDMTTLKISHNSLSKFDDVDISVLKELDLSYNMFTSLESTTLEGTQDVTIVNFSHNKITKIDDTFRDLNKLRYLDLSYNKLLGSLSVFTFETNEELETLSLSNNLNLTTFNGFKGEFNALYKLDISYCGLKMLNEDVFKNLQQITTLDLSGNALTALSPKIFSKLTRLNNLDLSENKLTNLDEDLFQGNMDLRKLSIRGNRLFYFPARLFKPVVHLTSFDASNCHLKHLWNSENAKYMKENNVLNQLNYLNLEGNEIMSLSKHSFESMSSLKILDITKNPLQCDEHFILLIEWLVQSQMSIGRYFGKSSSDLVKEHSELHWSDMLNKVCASAINGIPNKVHNEKSNELKHVENVDDSEKDTFTNENNNGYKFSPKVKKDDIIYMKNIPDIDYTSNFGLIPEPVIKSDAPNDTEYPWVWPLFLVFICGASILLALFNLAALLLYRTGKNYKVPGYRSTFIAPLSSQLKMRRDAGSFYHKLYEECSVPNSAPIVKQSGDFIKAGKKSTIILNGATKGEDMV